MPLAAQLTDVALVTSLRSDKCPACGGVKKRGHTFCFRQYRALPATLRSALYARLRYGYREAVLEAMQFLDVETFQVDRCSKCGEPGLHFVPPSLGERGFYLCDHKEAAGG